MRAIRAAAARDSYLGLGYVVTHPGNATDGDVASGLERHADAITLALETVPLQVLLELAAGAGSCLGGTFEELAAILEGAPEPHRSRMVEGIASYVRTRLTSELAPIPVLVGTDTTFVPASVFPPPPSFRPSTGA